MNQSVYFQALKDISELLSERYAIQYSALYWKNEEGQFAPVTSFSPEDCDNCNAEIPFSLSRSLIGAIRKAVFIPNTVRDLNSIDEKPSREDNYLLIIVPLQTDRIVGLLAMWCRSDRQKMEQDDRLLLEFAGQVVLKGMDRYHELSTVEHSASPSVAEMSVHFKTEPEIYEPSELTMEEVPAMASPEIPVDIQNPPSSISEPPVLSPQTESKTPSEKSCEAIDYLQYSTQGFMAFNKDCEVIYANYKQLEKIFRQDLSDKNALDILFSLGIPANPESTSFTADPKKSTIDDLLMTIFMRITDLDVMIELLPSELNIQGHYYRVEFSYIKADNMENDCILCIFNDISREKSLQYQTEIETSRSSMIAKVALDPSGYQQTRDTVLFLLDRIHSDLSKPLNEKVLRRIIHRLHSIQMGVDIFDIKDISDTTQEMIDDFENMIKALPIAPKKKEEISYQVDHLKNHCFEIEEKYLNSFFSENQEEGKHTYQITENKLNSIYNQFAEQSLTTKLQEMESIFEKNYRPFTRLPRLHQITNQRLERIKNSLWKTVGTPCKEELKELFKSLKQQPLGLFFDRYAVAARNLAQKHNKQVEVRMEGKELELPMNRYEALLNSLIHVVRNSVEHGIEKMEERVFYDKELEGLLIFKAKVDDSQLHIELSDDGKGIDLEKIKQDALACHLLKEEESSELSQKEILNLLFQLGAQTETEDDTHIRGIGLNIVRKNVEELHGTIQITTESEKGTAIHIQVPLETA